MFKKTLSLFAMTTLVGGALIVSSHLLNAQSSSDPAANKRESSSGEVTKQLQSSDRQLFMKSLPRGSMTAQEIIGARVLGAQDEEIGQVADIILTGDGAMTGVVVKVGGLLGVGAKRVALQSAALSRPGPNGDLRTDLTQQQIAAAPEIAAAKGLGDKVMESLDLGSGGDSANN